MLADPGKGILEAPPGLLPASRAPPGAPSPVCGAHDGHVDSLQLVPAHLQPTEQGQKKERSLFIVSETERTQKQVNQKKRWTGGEEPGIGGWGWRVGLGVGVGYYR